MIKKTAIVLVGILVVLAIVIATRPAAFKIVRSAKISAPADVVFANLDDFHAWPQWSPWAKLDPNMKTSYAGPASGPGASYSWSGDSKVGEGKMTIKESNPSQSVVIALDFEAPMKAQNLAVFTIKPSGEGVNVDWTMTGENGFVGKAFSMVMDMDKMVGDDFEKGLANLKSVSEAEATKRADAAKAAATAAAVPPPAPPPSHPVTPVH
jgi:hypothetical protein